MPVLDKPEILKKEGYATVLERVLCCPDTMFFEENSAFRDLIASWSYEIRISAMVILCSGNVEAPKVVLSV